MKTASITSYLDAKQIGHPPPGYRQPSATHLGRVRLAVANLERSLRFYTETIGLAVIEKATPDKRIVKLGANGGQVVLLELEELPGVRPIARRARLGLYHAALLLPSREALSSFVQHLNVHQVYFGSADHEVSEALYLTDPDGLSIEVYADKPKLSWRVTEGWILGGTQPLQMELLPMVPADSWKGTPAGTKLGHLHFYVDDLRKATDFYHGGLGFDLTGAMTDALFMSVGGYHHHVAVNTWASGSPMASANDARLLFWELALPNHEEIDRVAQSMTSAGFDETRSVTGARAFVDHLGLTVALMTDSSSSPDLSDAT